MNNNELIEKYPWLKSRNLWTGEEIDNNNEYTWLDDMPNGWKKTFGLQLCEELDKILKKANYRNDYRISQIKEKWRILTLV